MPHPCGYCNADSSRRAHRQLVALYELSRAVPSALRLRENSLSGEIAFDVLGESVGCGVAVLWWLTEGLQGDGVEVALQGASEFLWGCGTGLGLFCVSYHFAGPHRVAG